MKKKLNLLKITSIMFVIISMFFINIGNVYAQQKISQDGGGAAVKDPYTSVNPNDYKPTDPTTDDAVELVDKVGVILGAIRNISAVTSVIIIMIIGTKYIFGSVEEKANYKSTMIPYIIGCVMAVSGTTIVSFIYNYVK